MLAGDSPAVVVIDHSSGPSVVEIDGGNQPSIVEINQGPTGDFISTVTETNLNGYIYGDGSNVAGATRGVDFSANVDDMYGTIAVRNGEDGSLLANSYRFFAGGMATMDDAPLLNGSADAGTYWSLPNQSGYVAITTNATGSAANVEIYAKATTTIPKGAVVYISGASGANKLISLAQANNEPLSSKTIGVSIQALATNEFGYVMTEGDLTGLGINLGPGHGVVEGDPIWLSPTTPGGMVFGVANKPSAPNHMVFIGYVLRINGNTLDEIYVKIQNGFELEELHNVSITNPLGGQLLGFSSVTGLWGNYYQSSSTPVVGSIVQRDLNGNISQQSARLYPSGIPWYAQINGSPSMTSNTSFTLPSASGTIATNNTALMLTGIQTAAGAKTFSGQIEMTGQTLPNTTSAVTRGLGDARYGRFFSSVSNQTYNITDTGNTELAFVILPIGTYQIDLMASGFHTTTPYGVTINLTSFSPIRVGLTDYYGAFDESKAVPIVSDSTTYLERINSTLEFRRHLTGWIEVITDNTRINLSAAVGFDGQAATIRKRAQIVARKLT
jgi:hypothetical protein